MGRPVPHFTNLAHLTHLANTILRNHIRLRVTLFTLITANQPTNQPIATLHWLETETPHHHPSRH